MRKVFILCGEASGDNLAAWYVKRFYPQPRNSTLMAIGGDALAACGVQQYCHYDQLNVTGIVEILWHLPRLLTIMRNIITYLIAEQYQEIIVVDFPGFNLALIKRLKKKYPAIHVTYLSPPQLWCWGAWRIKKLKQYSNKIIVLYPFEQAWYAQRGVTVEYLGNPTHERLTPLIQKQQPSRTIIALIPGSRTSEIERFIPLFVSATIPLLQKNPELYIFIPGARAGAFFEKTKKLALASGLAHYQERVFFNVDPEKKYELLAQACCALTKPGTITLELALLGIPSIVAFKISWLTYYIARIFAKVRFMALPNLFTNRMIYEEFIQGSCTKIQLAQAIEKLYASYVVGDNFYLQQRDHLRTFSRLFEKKN